MSIILAAAALVVSLAALYTSSLRPAEIAVDLEIIGGEFGRGGATNHRPTDDRLRLCVAVSNTGAHGGLVEGIELRRFEYVGDQPRLWDAPRQIFITEDDVWSRHSPGVRKLLPFPLEAGDMTMLYINAPWVPSRDRGEYEPGQAPVWSYAERLRGLEAIRVEIAWQYRRVAGGWRSLVPGRGRTRETREESSMVEIDGQQWREACLQEWASAPENIQLEVEAILRREDPPPRDPTA